MDKLRFSRKYVIPTESSVKMHVVGLKWPPEIVKIAPSLADKGWGNGYVRLPPDHKYFKISKDEIPYEVNGGLTFAGLQKYRGKEYWVIGFDTMHFNDTVSIKKRHVVQMTRELHKQAEKDYNYVNELLDKLDNLEKCADLV